MRAADSASLARRLAALGDELHELAAELAEAKEGRPAGETFPDGNNIDAAGWYCAHVAANVASGHQPSPAADAQAAAFVGLDLSRAELRTLRQRHAPASWQAPGRKKSTTARFGVIRRI